uniref:Uncharacterized protein n=1 Tax=Onchocerca volvulus TaxID=6282 RepID=A0A8R1XQD9_ONCVO
MLIARDSTFAVQHLAKELLKAKRSFKASYLPFKNTAEPIYILCGSFDIDISVYRNRRGNSLFIPISKMVSTITRTLIQQEQQQRWAVKKTKFSKEK